MKVLAPWALAWEDHVSTAFLGTYMDTAAGAPFLPKREEDTELLLDFYELEKVIYEIGYELNNRPDWVRLPLLGILGLLEEAPHEPKRA